MWSVEFNYESLKFVDRFDFSTREFEVKTLDLGFKFKKQKRSCIVCLKKLWDLKLVGREWSIFYIGMEISHQWTRFKNLKESPNGKTQRGQCLLVVGLGRYKRY